ncbi:TnsD family Tn7-like transposition protein [Paenibacillus sp. Dod16]|nr:hypothetical protein BK142_30665 [Paenibacillus glucanolyticus]
MVILTGFFPSLFPDELLYSALARYHLYAGNHSSKATMTELYNGSVFCAATGLPAHIDQISHLMRHNMSPSEIIQSHTLLPYFAAFLPEDRTHFVKSAMTGELGRAVNARLGLLASTVKNPPFLRVCPQCIIEDEITYGLPYWHRSHQLPGVLVCYKHECILEDSVIPYTLRRNRHEYVSLKRDLIRKKMAAPHSCNVQKKHLIFLAKQSHALLNMPYDDEYLNNIPMYRAKLSKRGFITPNGNIRFQNLRSNLYQTLGKDLLHMCHSEINKHSEDTWLHKLLRGHDYIHSLRHLLVMQFLAETIDSICEMQKETYHPFGTGPWPCLNKVADHFKENTIPSCIVTRCSDTGRPVGTFKCNCGFVYSRRGPDTSECDRVKIGRIKQFGIVWEQKFDELRVNSNLSLRQKAECLGVHRSTLYLKMKEQPRSMDKYESFGENVRTIDLDLLSEDLSNQTNATCYSTAKEDILQIRVDWEKRDRELLPIISQAVREIRSTSGKPIRVTISEIGRRIGKLSLLEKKLVALPRCKALIDREVETIHQFQIRRIEVAAQKLFEEEQSVVKWKLIRNAGLRKDAAVQLDNVINSVISYYNGVEGRTD